MAQAFAMGMDQEIMRPPVASYHQYHPGSWGATSSGVGEGDLATRPSLGQRKYIEDGRDMMIKGTSVTLWGLRSDASTELGCNHNFWGFGNIALHEMQVQPSRWNLSRNAMRVVCGFVCYCWRCCLYPDCFLPPTQVRQPFDQMKHAKKPGCGWKYVLGAKQHKG